MKAKKLQESDDYENDSQLSESTKFNFDDDLRRCSGSPIGHVIPNQYCYCGRLRSIYKSKLTNFNLNSDERLYDVNKLTNDVLELSKGAVYVTKKSLMLNQFLEFTDTKVVKAVDNTNKFNNGGGADNGAPFQNNSMCMVKVQENENSRSVCLSSSLFTDKRLVSLFRSVALYWFFCLNTVFARGDVFRRKALSYDGQSTALTPFDSNELNLKISPIVLDNLENINDDYFWRIISSVALYEDDENERDRSLLLPFAEYSRQKMYTELLKKMLTYVLNRLCRFLRQAEELTNSNSRSSSRNSFTSIEPEPPGCSDNKIGLHSYVSDWISRGNLFKNEMEFEYEVGMNLYDDEIRIEEVHDDREESETDDGTDGEEKERSEGSTAKYSITGDESSISSHTQVTEFDSDVEGWADEEEEEELLDEEDSDNGAKFQNNATSTLASDQNGYFLPEGIFNIDENDYPQYNLWCSPLIIDEVLSHKQAFTEMPKQEVDREANTFKPYSLWESSVAAVDEQIPDFYFGEEFSVFSIPYHPNRNNQAIQHSSTYSLWGSPNIIDFLPSIKCLAEEDSATMVGNSSADLEHVRKSLEEAGSQFCENYFSQGKFLNLRPVVNNFITFTDRGAFEYYKKPRLDAFECYEKPACASKVEPEDNVTIVCENPISFLVEAKPIVFVDETENEACSVKNAEKPTLHELNSEYFFKPIQPAFRVETDCPPFMERSASGTFFIQSKKFLTFKHELDNHRVNDDDNFQPKYEVNTNDKACQTENATYFNRWNYDILYEEEMSLYGPTWIEKKVETVQAPYNAAFFYALEEVFNVLEKPDIGGMGMAANPFQFGQLF